MFLISSGLTQLNSSLTAEDNLNFRFATDGEGNYGYLDGDDTFVPFSGIAHIKEFLYTTPTSAYSAWVNSYDDINGGKHIESPYSTPAIINMMHDQRPPCVRSVTVTGNYSGSFVLDSDGWYYIYAVSGLSGTGVVNGALQYLTSGTTFSIPSCQSGQTIYYYGMREPKDYSYDLGGFKIYFPINKPSIQPPS